MGYTPKSGNLQLEGTRTNKPFWESVEDEDGGEFEVVWDEGEERGEFKVFVFKNGRMTLELDESGESKRPWGFSSSSWYELDGLLFFHPVSETEAT
ncbi:hypothetical protein MNV49_005467 [Pseudohyphozyma bogoriensis]|nr:hypothetical protein MNV49_005467 [Pseudohyphozyma bogoriensis]